MLVAAVILSALGLTIGPGLVALGQRHQPLSAAIAGFTPGAVPTLVVTRLLPHLYEEAGLSVPLLMVGGYVGASWLEDRGGHSARGQAAFVFPALAVHSLLDGAALASVFAVRGDGAAAHVLGVALVAYRVPEGLLLGAVFVPRLGLRDTLKRTGLLAAATFLGAVGEAAVLAHRSGVAAHAMIALPLGVLLHSVVHGHRAPSERGAATTETLALLGGTATALALSPRQDLGAGMVAAVAASVMRVAGHGTGCPIRNVANAAACNGVARGAEPGRTGWVNAILTREPASSLDWEFRRACLTARVTW